MRANIYVASSWRNAKQPGVVKILRGAGFDVYDFRNPKPGDNGFHWSEIDPNWKDWTCAEYVRGLEHPTAKAGFASDFEAMKAADACVLVLPCGRSAHLEAGWFVGRGKPVFALLDVIEPELMYAMFWQLCSSEARLVLALTDAFPERSHVQCEVR